MSTRHWSGAACQTRIRVTPSSSGVTLEKANAYLEMKTQENIRSEGTKSYGQAARWGMFSLPMNEFAAGPMQTPLTMLLIAVGMVLLIACANIAGLQITRASARERELAAKGKAGELP